MAQSDPDIQECIVCRLVKDIQVPAYRRVSEDDEEAEAQGVPVPLNKRMIELVYDIEEGRRSQSWENLKLLKAEMV